MADSFTPNINLRKPEVGHADDVWGGVAGLNGDLDLLDAVFLATGLSTVASVTGPFSGVPGVGLRIGKGMVLNAEGQIQHKDPTDITKVGVFSMDQIPTATTVDLKYPAAGGTIATVEVVTAVATAAHPVGTILSGYYGPTPPSGYVFLWGTIGGPESVASNRANADCERLFKHFWTITGDTQCPLFLNDGTPSVRGATAQADWDLKKRLQLPPHAGRTMAGRDDLSGTAAGVMPATVVPLPRGSIGGVAAAGITLNEMPTGIASLQATGPSFYQFSNAVAVYLGYQTQQLSALSRTQPTIAVDVIIAL